MSLNSKRNTVVVATIALTIVLLLTPWSLRAGMSWGQNCQDTWQGIPLAGAWIATLENGALVSEWTVAPQNSEHTEFISVLRQVKPNPSNWGLTPEADRETDWIGQTVQTDWNTFESTVVSYGTKNIEGQQQPQIVYISVMYASGRLVDLNTIEAEGTLAIFLAEQDADHDGFPDEGQTPLYCGPYALSSCKRVQIIPPCELPPSLQTPKGQ